MEREIPDFSHLLRELSPELQERYRWSTAIQRRALTPVASLCSWLDLHGFTGLLARANWALATAQDQGLFDLLRFVIDNGTNWGEAPPPGECVLVLNDGIARVMDLDRRPDSQAFGQYVYEVLDGFCVLAESLRREAHAVHLVLAGGERMQYAPESENGVHNPIPLQMNTALSRAYLVERGIHDPGSWVYIEANWIKALERLKPPLVEYLRSADGGIVAIVGDSRPILELRVKNPVCVCDRKHSAYNLQAYRVVSARPRPGLLLFDEELAFPE